MAKQRMSKSAKRGAQIGATYGMIISSSKGHPLKTRAGVTAVTTGVGAAVGHGVGRRKEKRMSTKGSWKGGAAPAQGAAKSPQFSSAHTGSGFAWGIRQRTEASKSASPLPKNISNHTGAGMKPRKGNWGSGFQKP